MILLGRITDPATLPDQSVISTITLAELSVGPQIAAARKRAARAYDALIAATAIANGLPLYTCNPEDFEGIPALDLHSVPHPDR
ncbi:MAG: hypothetical protein ACR2JI_16970 [Mycobacterium sp.]